MDICMNAGRPGAVIPPFVSQNCPHLANPLLDGFSMDFIPLNIGNISSVKKTIAAFHIVTIVLC